MREGMERIVNSRRSALFAITALTLPLLLAVVAWQAAGGRSSGDGLTEILLMAAGGGFWLVFVATAAWFNALVFITFCTFGFVWKEPAPIDVLVPMLLLAGLATGKLRLRSLKGDELIHIGLFGFVLLHIPALFTVPKLTPSLLFSAVTFYLVAFTYLLKMYATSPSRVRTIVLGYLVTCVATGVGSFLGAAGVPPFSDLTVGKTRIQGFFKDPNVLGPFLVPCAILLVDEMIRPRLIRLSALFKLGALLLVTGTVVLTLSRAAWLNLAFSLCAYFALTLKHFSRRGLILKTAGFVLAGTVVSSVGIVYAMNEFGFRELFESRAVPLQRYDYDRFAGYVVGLELSKANFFGIGAANFQQGHSLYIRTASEQGVLGAACFLIFHIALLWKVSWAAWKDDSRPLGLAPSVVAAGLAGLTVNAIVIDTIHWRHMWFLFGLAWAISSVAPVAALRMVPRAGAGR